MRKLSLRAAVRGASTTAAHTSEPSSQAASSRSPGGVPGGVGGRDLEKEIVEIAGLSLDDLRIRWRNVCGRLAPAHISRAQLARILAYRVQAQSFGNLDRNTTRALERWSEPVERKKPNGQTIAGAPGESADISSAPERRTTEPLILKPGTLLTREWQGWMETVMVVPDGFAWNGEMYASLSAVAQSITGTKWNGHRFFGVRPQDRSLRKVKETDEASVQVEGHGEVRTNLPGLIRKRLPRRASDPRRVDGVTR